VIVLVSKPPAPAVAGTVLAQVAAGDKPTVVCFLGGDPEPIAAAGAIPACILQEAALLAAQAAGADLAADEVVERETRDLELQAEDLRPSLKAEQRYVRGLFSGGTLCYEAQVIWRDLVAEPVLSNAPLDAAFRLSDSTRSQGHTAVDWAKRSSPSGGRTP